MQAAAASFRRTDTHGILETLGASFGATSEGLGWRSLYASKQRERPFEAHFHAVSDALLVLHRGGPVDVVFRQDGRSYVRHIPKGGLFFLPAGHECDVNLQATLDTTHIYLRSHLFADDSGARGPAGGLAPLFGGRDPVIEYLAEAVGQIVDEAMPSSLAVDPIASALAHRFIDINHGRSASPVRRAASLSGPQAERVRAYIEAHLDTNIGLDALAALCGMSTEHFVRMFKATTGQPPYQYVISRRVERAKQLLVGNRETLADIALACGFSHQEHLTRMFRRITGVTPGRYRSSLR